MDAHQNGDSHIRYVAVGTMALLLLVVFLGTGPRSIPVAEAQNLDPSCIAQAQKAGPCVSKPYGPRYNSKCQTSPGPLQYEGYIGAPCKENDGTSFKVGGKCVPGNKCQCESCKADGDKGGMPPMLPMLPMMMPMMPMDMPMMPQDCLAQGANAPGTNWTDSGAGTRAEGTASSTATSTTTTTTPHTPSTRNCDCSLYPYAEGCQASGSSGLLNSFGSSYTSGGLFQNATQGALNLLGNIADSVGGSVVETAANAIETLTGVDINTNAFTHGNTTVNVSPIDLGSGGVSGTGGTVGVVQAQNTQTSQGPQYAYDSDTSGYGAFSGTPEPPSLVDSVVSVLAGILNQLQNVLSNLLNAL